MENLLGNTWYYTLSTIAQVFATILGLYSVFVIFKVEKLNGFIEELRSILINLIASVETHKNINSTPKKSQVDEQTLISLSNENLLKRSQKAVITAKEIGMSASYRTDRVAYREMRDIPSTFKIELNRKKEVISSFKINLIILIFVIIFTLISLGFSEFINTVCLKNSILFFSVLISVFSSIFLSFSILKIIKE